MMTKEKEDAFQLPQQIEELKVNLPEPAISAGKSNEKEPVILGIDFRGQFYIGANPVGRSILLQRLHQIAQTGKERHIRMEVDRNAPSARLIEMLDLLAFEGLTNYGIHTLNKRYGDDAGFLRPGS